MRGRNFLPDPQLHAVKACSEFGQSIRLPVAKPVGTGEQCTIAEHFGANVSRNGVRWQPTQIDRRGVLVIQGGEDAVSNACQSAASLHLPLLAALCPDRKTWSTDRQSVLNAAPRFACHAAIHSAHSSAPFTVSTQTAGAPCADAVLLLNCSKASNANPSRLQKPSKYGGPSTIESSVYTVPVIYPSAGWITH